MQTTTRRKLRLRRDRCLLFRLRRRPLKRASADASTRVNLTTAPLGFSARSVMFPTHASFHCPAQHPSDHHSPFAIGALGPTKSHQAGPTHTTGETCFGSHRNSLRPTHASLRKQSLAPHTGLLARTAIKERGFVPTHRGNRKSWVQKVCKIMGPFAEQFAVLDTVGMCLLGCATRFMY